MSSPADALTAFAADDAVVGTLSPSRAGDFMTCPLLYRFRHVDRLPERPSLAAARGTVVHRVLEVLFDEPAQDRTPERATALLAPAWAHVAQAEPAILEVLAEDGVEEEVWLAECATALRRYFDLEDPSRLEPAEREVYIETVTDDRLVLRGIVDRLDVAPDGRVRVVDYKTGRAPGVGFEARALFQMRFYALVLERSRGIVPSVLQLMYLGSGEIIADTPDPAVLRATERKVQALWEAISTARRTGEWVARPSRLCSWCSHQALCPAYGGTPPPLPDAPSGATRLPDPTFPEQGGAQAGVIAPEAISST